MKSLIKYVNLTCWIGLSAAVTALAEPTPSPSPTSTPHTEPSASPTPSGTPRREPTPTPSPSATPGDDHDGVSLRGVYGATTPTGSLIVFCIEKNTFVQVNMLDIAGQVIGFAEGPLYHGLVSLKLTTGQPAARTSP